jgi:hypothetical protein
MEERNEVECLPAGNCDDSSGEAFVFLRCFIAEVEVSLSKADMNVVDLSMIEW